jgi:uncharacterized DUF497 family protein
MRPKIEFDPAKDAINVRVHGVSLAQAEALLQGFIFGWQDKRRDYGEARMIAIGEIGAREFVCVYTLRGDVIRPISLRRANRKERNVYQQAKAVTARPGEQA